LTRWHADIDRPVLGAGARLTVLSPNEVVRVLTADTLVIETPSGQRLSAVVLDRTGGALRLMIGGNVPVSLEILRDESLHPPGPRPAVFSRQVWLTH
jgi:hypothetical protein